MYILFPGRHHLLTKFQFDYLQRIISSKFEGVLDVDGNNIPNDEVDGIIFAVTSSNHSNTRRNPVPFYMRAMALQLFGNDLDVPTYVYGIDDVGHLSNFASYTLKRIKHESNGRFDLSPRNTHVLCSTPVLEMYEKLGFRILPAELVDRNTYEHNKTNPWEVVEMLARATHPKQLQQIWSIMHESSYEVYEKYWLGKRVGQLFDDQIIGEDGDITETRDYNSYVRQMDEIAELKYSETSPYIQSGRIGDIGCAVGSWIKLACEDQRLRESDFYGIEVARQLYDICLQRKHNGEFTNPFVFFAQKNAVTDLVFEKNSMATIHTSSLTHEIESYGGREDLKNFIANRYAELQLGGVWINRDVLGPENGDEQVFLKINQQDGRNDDLDREIQGQEELAKYLSGLSTYGRFLRFAQDFRRDEGYKVKFEIEDIDGKAYIQISLRDACEYLSKKDYIDNWRSEMHETFCFWSFQDWERELSQAGLTLLKESKAYTNQWIVDNRIKDKAEIFRKNQNKLEAVTYPVTNMLIIAQKR